MPGSLSDPAHNVSAAGRLIERCRGLRSTDGTQIRAKMRLTCLRIATNLLAMRKQVRGGPALFRLVRFWSRRWTSAGQAGAPSVHVQVLEAVDAASRRGDASVTSVAEELGIDRSGASRMVSAAVEAGYVRKAASSADARQAQLLATRQGNELLGAARAWQQSAFERMVADWPAADAARFARYLERLSSEATREHAPR
jgi:DNA-binding MarR family transcriptional regulator